MNRVGISTACLYPDNMLTSVEKISGTGSPVMELFCNSIYETGKENLIKVKEAALKNNCEIVSLHPFTAVIEGLLFFSGYRERINDGIALYRRFFEAAQFLGAKYIVFHGEKNKTTFGQTMISEDDLIEIYDKIASVASEYGLLFTQENVAHFRSENPELLRKMRLSLGSKIGFTFDVKQALRAGRDIYETLSAMGENLKHVHINDFGYSTECALPFTGDLDMLKLADYLKNISYDGDFIVEVYRKNFDNIDSLEKARRNVKEIFADNVRKFTLCRIENDKVMLETEGQKRILVPKNLMPETAKENDILIFSENRYTIDTEHTDFKKELIKEKVRKLFE